MAENMATSPNVWLDPGPTNRMTGSHPSPFFCWHFPEGFLPTKKIRLKISNKNPHGFPSRTHQVEANSLGNGIPDIAYLATHRVDSGDSWKQIPSKETRITYPKQKGKGSFHLPNCFFGWDMLAFSLGTSMVAGCPLNFLSKTSGFRGFLLQKSTLERVSGTERLSVLSWSIYQLWSPWNCGLLLGWPEHVMWKLLLVTEMLANRTKRISKQVCS